MVTGFGVEAIFLVVTGFMASSTAALVSLTIAVGFSGFAISGWLIDRSNEIIMTRG